ncbi:hypothetical protein TIFTF001_027245 [Ficus carica]|uniref:Uncharacterized protein n=1 Tax=Ficus carica TaxID=3494 RepID=A0AA88J009_FICCA|nr:hypothetical protein TIFTF001_027245 [Ficus carica]
MNGLWKDIFSEWKVLFRHRNDLVREGLPSLDRVRVGIKGIKVVVYLGTPIPEVLYHRSCRQKLWCIGEGAPPSRESLEKIQYAREWIPNSGAFSLGKPLDLERVSSLGHEWR